MLFICTGNSCRSQMAEGYVNALLGGFIEAQSAGTHPALAVSELAVHVMAELGIDISDHKPKSVAELEGNKFDLYVTLCAGADRECASITWLKPHIHVPFEDPITAVGTEDEILAAYRRVRDDIADRLPKALTVL